MQFSQISALLLGLAATFATADPTRATNLTLAKPSHPLLEWNGHPRHGGLVPAFTAKIDWDLDNNHSISIPQGTRASWWAREGHWYDVNGTQFGQILRANDDGLVPVGTRFLELLIFYVVQLDDGYWAYVKHTGGAILRKSQNGVVRVETASPKYQWLNQIDFIGPGSFNGTEVMTVHHYFPNAEAAKARDEAVKA